MKKTISTIAIFAILYGNHAAAAEFSGDVLVGYNSKSPIAGNGLPVSDAKSYKEIAGEVVASWPFAKKSKISVYADGAYTALSGNTYSNDTKNLGTGVRLVSGPTDDQFVMDFHYGNLSFDPSLGGDYTETSFSVESPELIGGLRVVGRVFNWKPKNTGSSQQSGYRAGIKTKKEILGQDFYASVLTHGVTFTQPGFPDTRLPNASFSAYVETPVKINDVISLSPRVSYYMAGVDTLPGIIPTESTGLGFGVLLKIKLP